MLRNKERYRESVNKGIKWLVAQMNEDGSMNPVEKGPLTYYKVPRALAIAGRLKEANLLLDWVKREIFTPEGDFRTPRKGFHAAHYTYSSCWFVWVAQVMSRFDVSYSGMNYLLRFRNSKTGGYCSEATFSPDNKNEQDLLSTAFTSFVGLHLGLLKEAEISAQFIERLMHQQPDLEKRLWLRTDGSGRIITYVPEGYDEPRYYVLEAKAPKQYYYYIGAAMVFLAKLYTITRNKSYLDLANVFFRFALSCHQDVFLTDGTGKVGLGLAYLYKATADQMYVEAIQRACDFLVGDQEEEGYWMRDRKPTASSTGEFCVWLSEVLAIF